MYSCRIHVHLQVAWFTRSQLYMSKVWCIRASDMASIVTAMIQHCCVAALMQLCHCIPNQVPRQSQASSRQLWLDTLLKRQLHCDVQVETVATTLTLAEQNHAEELKRVCLEFASRNLSTVMCSDGYHHMISSCPQLQVRPTFLSVSV